jgi:Rne/Rng family ribonuclease
VRNKKEILINFEQQERRVAILEDGRLENYFVERPQVRSVLGNIYKGRVETVVPSVGAAFVNIGGEKNGFLYLNDSLAGAMGEEVDESHPVALPEEGEVQAPAPEGAAKDASQPPRGQGGRQRSRPALRQ